MEAEEQELQKVNLLKYSNYQEQFKRLKKALTNQFYLEALFIEYAIIEDRTAAILRYEGNQIKSNNNRIKGTNIGKKLEKISALSNVQGSLPQRYFADDTIQRAFVWKDKRNDLIHALMEQKLTTGSLEDLALEGQSLAAAFTNKAKCYKRAVERREKKQLLTAAEPMEN